MTIESDIESRIGELMIVGLPGTELTAEVAADLRRITPAGVIFFAPNFPSAAAAARVHARGTGAARLARPSGARLRRRGGRDGLPTFGVLGGSAQRARGRRLGGTAAGQGSRAADRAPASRTRRESEFRSRPRHPLQHRQPRDWNSLLWRDGVAGDGVRTGRDAGDTGGGSDTGHQALPGARRHGGRLTHRSAAHRRAGRDPRAPGASPLRGHHQRGRAGRHDRPPGCARPRP